MKRNILTLILILFIFSIAKAQDIKLKGTVSAENNQIKNLAEPTNGQDATTKSYVDQLIQNLQSEINALQNTTTSSGDVDIYTVEVFNQVTLNGILNDLGSGVRQHGFIWSTNVNPPSINNYGNGGKIDLGPTPTTGSFSKVVSVNELEVNQTIYINSFVDYADDTVSYSSVKEFTINSSWEAISPLPESRYLAVAFAVDNIGYVTTGYDGVSTVQIAGGHTFPDYQNTLYSYDPNTNNWSNTGSDFNRSVRGDAVSFVQNNMAYVGGGRGVGNGRFNDISRYNPSTNAWESINNLPQQRTEMVSFVLNGKGYAGTGTDDNTPRQNVYSYNDVNNLWESISSFPIGTKRAFGFALNGAGFVGSGVKSSWPLNITKEIYKYDLSLESWVQLNDFPIGVYDTFSFVIGDKAYVGGGVLDGDGNTIIDNVFLYNEINDSWIEVESFPTPIRNAKTFVIGNNGYVGTGKTPDSNGTNIFYKFTPPTKIIY